jgi:ATP-dependent Clp protease ATP-binding subunit ClpC
VVRRVLGEAAADPDQIRAQLEEETEKEVRNDVAPSLAPDAKRALLGAYEEAQALDSSYIGPEHVLLALAADDEGEAGRLLSRFALSHTKLRGAVTRTPSVPSLCPCLLLCSLRPSTGEQGAGRAPSHDPVGP